MRIWMGREAWRITTASCDVVVAVNDSGVDVSHEDPSSNICMNPREDVNGNGVLDPSDSNVPALNPDSVGEDVLVVTVSWRWNLRRHPSL